MKRNFVKTGALFLAILMFVATFAVSDGLSASSYISLQSGDRVQVIEIIDINAIRVRTPRGDALVRLIGVHHGGTPQGMNFLTREIMGNHVHVVRDPLFPNVGRWNYLYIMHVERFINGELILTGFGRLNEAHYRAAQFENIRQGQAIAREAGLGQWANELRTPIITQYGERININTADAAQIMAHLGAGRDLANSIVSFRGSAVFQTVNDVKFVPGVTWEFFASNRNRMAIVTNINTANIPELESLANITAEQAEAIVESRSGGRSFTAASQLVTRGIMNPWEFNIISPFISLQTEVQTQFARPNIRANVNLASQTQLIASGASFTQAIGITTQRGFLPMRNLHDLKDMPGFETMEQINALADNLRAYTNINTAPRSEIESLFGENVLQTAVDAIMDNRPFVGTDQISEFFDTAIFNRIEPFIYVGSRPPYPVVNINTATHQQLMDAGFYDAEAARIVNNRPILRPSQMVLWQTVVRPELRANITLYTNINNATNQELMSLDGAMTQDVASRIVSYRNDQPFGSFAEVEDFFAADAATWEMFLRFRNFIILR
ncbi:MAG: helix-hairpin-helix domain-containing protein [Clostridiales bacterium]|jgi:DNA uptake protein ComE-like DNA-binding protein|nr:helix-hairpin-helix domain-containing protein [Clostridiales bacterium]